ncbi:MAG: DUF4174 domain-containing protein, partial [Bacteroidota bacterium]
VINQFIYFMLFNFSKYLFLSWGLSTSADFDFKQHFVEPSLTYQEDSLDLQDFRWKNRIILLFGYHSRQESFQIQRALLQNQSSGLKERDLLLFQVFKMEEGKYLEKRIKKSWAQALRQKFRVGARDFCLILIGKDGGVKLKSNKAVPVQEIFALIDGMPMRQREMRERKN